MCVFDKALCSGYYMPETNVDELDALLSNDIHVNSSCEQSTDTECADVK